MRRILVINPNTTRAVTDKVAAACEAIYPQHQWQGVTARIGATYIASETAYAIASHAVLDAYAEHHAGHDVVMLACFGDPGLLALREVSTVPVVGLAQASFEAAQSLGPFAVVTGGKTWGPMLERFARAHVLDDQLVGVYTVDLNGAQIAAAPEAAMDALAAACQEGLDAGAQHLVLGGAALTGLAHVLQARLGVVVFDSVVLGARTVVDELRRSHGEPASRAASLGELLGVSAKLGQLLA
jgi:allantoin racemase